MPKNTQFHGILAVGRTKADAVNNYRLLAMGKGATVQVDEAKNLAFVTHASHADGMFNPMSGNMDLGTDTTYMKQLEFASHSSGELEVNHLVCTSGCGAHVVFDSESLVKYCPHCTSSLSEDSSEEESEDAPEEEESEDAPEDDSDLEDGSDEGSDEEESEDAPEEEESDEEESDEESEDESAEEDKKPVAAEEEEITLPEYGEDDGDVSISSEEGLCVAADSLKQASALFVKNLPTKIKSTSSSIETHYVVCASSGCAAHIVSTEAVAECPACHGKVVEPKAEVQAALSSDGVSYEVEDENLDSPVRKTADVDAKDEDSATAKVVEASDDGDCDEDDEECDENTLDLADSEGNVLNEDTEDLDAMDEVEEESESSDLDVSYSSQVAGASRWTAYFKGTPVAIASKSSAGKNADIFDTPSFGHAALATAKVAGIRKALVELGFAPIKHKVSVSKAIRKMVDAQVAESRASISAEQAEYKERFAAALAASAIGLNRGFYADKKNPIKASMWSTLSSAGIRNPESLIDTVFKNHSDAYHKTLFELASDLTSKSAEVQESLSKAIYGMSYQEVSASSEGSLEGRLETFGTSVSSETQTKPQQQDTAGRQQISEAVRSLGRHGR